MITLFLAHLLGWYFVIIGIYCLIRYDNLSAAMADIIGQRGLMLFAAVITLILGLLLVLLHNVWIVNWPIFITLFAWLTLISGLVRLFFPETAIRMARFFLDNPRRIQVVGLVLLIFGLYFLIEVYYPYYIET